jgi:N-carbamoyl-L-amino-acid hydrolase
MKDISVDGERLWKRIMDMAEIGKTAKGGCNRRALTDEDKQGRDLFCEWAESVDCDVSVDMVGNIFARRAGTDATLPSVLIGSHLDTQPTGGRFDGVYGVLAGIEVIETLNDNNISTLHPIDIVNWTNEEGARFAPAMIGSGVFSGEMSLSESLDKLDKEGIRLGDELKRIGYEGSAVSNISERPVKAAFEVHIEQGPILESKNVNIGVVTGIQGLRWYDLIVNGQPAHAGTTPMGMRRDPFKGVTAIMQWCYELAAEKKAGARVTFGDLEVIPGSRNTIPSSLKLCVDFRNPDSKLLSQMDESFRKKVSEIAKETSLDIEIVDVFRMEVTEFDSELVQIIRECSNQVNESSMDIVSGAGHDSLHLSKVAPTAMIFIPCKDGLSHNEAESADRDHVEAGANVLLKAVIQVAKCH